MRSSTALPISLAPVAAEVGKYLSSDQLFYRAGGPRELRSNGRRVIGTRYWPGRSAEFGAHFTLGEGVIHVAQPDAALKAAGAAIPEEPWRLGAVHTVTTLTGSALLALALLRGRLTAEEAWLAAHIDEDWNMEQWGRDEIALERRAFRFAELQAAATVLSTLSGETREA